MLVGTVSGSISSSYTNKAREWRHQYQAVVCKSPSSDGHSFLERIWHSKWMDPFHLCVSYLLMQFNNRGAEPGHFASVHVCFEVIYESCKVRCSSVRRGTLRN
jgi:hypothetical protein